MKHLRNLLMIGGLVAGILAGSGAVTQADDQGVALKGYDPVAYFTEQRPRVGDPQYQHEWDGATYRFASPKHRDLFKADPDRYLPQYSNLCAVSVAQGVKLQGNPEYWLVVDGRLYLFGGPKGPGMMRADPVAIKSTADKNWLNVSRLPNPAQK